MGKLSQKNSAQLETSTIFLQFSRANQHFCITTINQSPSYQMFVKKIEILMYKRLNKFLEQET